MVTHVRSEDFNQSSTGGNDRRKKMSNWLRPFQGILKYLWAIYLKEVE